MDFFESFEKARWEFTYGAPDNESLNALQVGLVAHFYIDQGYLPEKRKAMADVFSLYDQEFGKNLTWGYYNNPKYPRKYHDISQSEKREKITANGLESMYFFWSSETGLTYTSDYRIRASSPAAWFEYIHHDVSCVSFYLPIEILKDRGFSFFDEWITRFCNILNPMHGLAGLGIQSCRNDEEYQHIEYEITQEFLGLDLAGNDTDSNLRNGIRSINWYSFFDNSWLEKLGKKTGILTRLASPGITLLPYDGGLIIRAGDWPELGWKKETPYPELYVAVNRALKPIRAPKIDSLHYGSICGEIRYDQVSTAQWLARFDVDLPSATGTFANPVTETAVRSPERPRIEAWSGARCPHSGTWGCWSEGALHHVRFAKGETLPGWPDEQRVLWSLLEREDGGDCFVSA